MSNFNDRIDEAKRLRMARGEAKHGPLDLENDPRDFVDEGIEDRLIASIIWKLPCCRGSSPSVSGIIYQTLRFMIFRVVDEKGKGVGHGKDFDCSCDVQQGVTGVLNGDK